MARMKGVDEFVWLLAIALVLVVIFMAASAVYPFNPLAVNQTQNATQGAVAAFSQLGYVGFSSSYTGQDINYGTFVAGQPQAEPLRKAVQMDICAGLWCSKSQEFTASVPDYYMDTMKGVRIKFAVYESNQYGELVLKWNGKEFYRAKPSPKDYEVFIGQQFVKEGNTLQIYAEGPGLAFWASTVYTIRDFSAELEYGPARISTFTLSQGELGVWNGGVLSFYGTGSQGQMRIKMNGNTVFQEMPEGYHEVILNFSNAGPKVGENLLVFDALGGGVFALSNARLKVYLLTNQVSKARVFQLGASDYGRLGSGSITFSVNSVQRDGSMSIKLNNRALNVPKVSVGANAVHFTGAEAVQGTNTLEFSGSGYWDVGDVTVNV